MKVEEQNRIMNTELEKRVRQRTAQLEQANKELEAFSYSVSHDLRAPLRSIEGYTQAILEDCGSIIDEQGKKYIERTILASRRMTQLIDDLLKLSQLTRSDLRMQNMDLSVLAREVMQGIILENPERTLDFIVPETMYIRADPAMMRILLVNLLGNAWKFSAKHSSTRIEVGKLSNNGEPAYFVRDDGAGFDMTYQDKLFTAFQRLHANNEFPGTGIGLAIVQRIVHRHYGKIWAEGKVEEGATFYFTLGE